MAQPQSMPMSEWFNNFGIDVSLYREEDFSKQNRLTKLSKILGTPTYQSYRFSISEILSGSDNFTDFKEKGANGFFTLSLIPKTTDLPKHRIKGVAVDEAVNWLRNLNVDESNYDAKFIDFSYDTTWSLNFVINKNGIFGEYCDGILSQITFGQHSGSKTVKFFFDFSTITTSNGSDETKKRILSVIKMLKVSEKKKRLTLEKELGSTFSSDYLNGYFEVINTKEYGLWFLDYNREIWKLYENFKPADDPSPRAQTPLMTGRVAHPGEVEGRVKVILEDRLFEETILDGEILVCVNTTLDYIQLIKSAAAVVTDQGGILSHAAIICREIGKPCIVATFEATTILKSGDLIKIDANGNIFRTA